MKQQNLFTVFPFLLVITVFAPQPVHAQTSATQAALNRGNAAVAAGNYDQAISEYTEVIRLAPNDPVGYFNRGFSYFNKNDYDRAITDYTQAIQRNHPELAVAYSIRGLAYYKKNDYDRAIADYTQAIRLNPNDAEAYENRGMSYWAKHDYDRAIADFEVVLRIDPNSTMSRIALEAIRIETNHLRQEALNRGTAASDAGNYDLAITEYTEAIRFPPSNAVLSMSANNRTQDETNQVLDYANAFFLRGWAYGAKNDYDRAIADFTEVIRLVPNAAEGYGYRGLIYFNKNDYDRAIVDYEAALRINPNWTEVAQSLEQARQAKGN